MAAVGVYKFNYLEFYVKFSIKKRLLSIALSQFHRFQCRFNAVKKIISQVDKALICNAVAIAEKPVHFIKDVV